MSNMQSQNDTNKYEQNVVKEIDLKSLFLVIKRRIWIVIVFAIIAGSLGYYFDSKNEPINLYESYTRLHLSSDGGIETLQQFIVDPIVLADVVSELELETTPEALAGKITVVHVGGQILEIRVTDTVSKRAANIANATAKVFINKAESIINVIGINHYLEAKENPIPTNLGDSSSLKFTALIAGIILGIGFVFLLNALDNSINSDQDIHKALGLPVLGNVSKINKRNTHKKNKKKANQQYISVRGETIDS
ncbi:YveK family protein [Fredinandcohnia sp. 179-A 10B2 NHS]|uniref:YveK family protein n=1 Tax=Fredinandcohnia sp. 179-A 10B2 NHS TaxID=3235176 RepID=UPI0039A082EF